MSRKVSLPSSLEIRLLGPFSLTVDGGPVIDQRLTRRKARLLVQLLALQPRHQLHREQIMECLWPEQPPESAANSLHKTIHAARRALEPALKAGSESRFLITQGDQVLLRAPERLWIDVDEFERQAAEAIGGGDVAGYEAALGLCRGELLSDEPYEDWAARRREQLHALHHDLLARLAALYEQDGQYQRSIDRLRELIAGDQSNEEAHRRLMRLYGLVGRRHQALQQYRQCCEAMRRELDAEPEQATTELHEQILSGQIQPLPAAETAPAFERARAVAAELTTTRPAARANDAGFGHPFPEQENSPAGQEANGWQAQGQLKSADHQVAEIITARSRRRFPHPAIAAVALAVLASIGAGVYLLAGRGGAIDSLAVLPFVNGSNDPDLEYLSDGITENLINRLSQLPGLRLVPRSTVFRYKGREVDPREAGRQLGVGAVLTGRITLRDGSLHIQAELTDVARRSQLWGEQYNRRLTDLIAVHELLAQEVSEKLRVRSPAGGQQRLARRYPRNPEAWQAWLKGRYLWDKRDAAGFRRAVEYFNQAIASDPDYPLAWAGLADCYALMAQLGALPPQEAYTKAKAAAKQALQLDEQLAEAHTSLARVLFYYDWDWAGSEREYRRAIELDPGYSTAHQWYSVLLSYLARHEEAIAEARRAQELEPLLLAANGDLVRAYYRARRYDQAIAHCLKMLELDAHDYFKLNYDLALAYEQKGLYDQAVAARLKALNIGGGTDWTAPLRDAYAASGWRGYWEKEIELVTRKDWQRYDQPSFYLAQLHARLGEGERAIEWLEKSYQEHADKMVMLKIDPLFDNLRADPRFRNLLRRVGLSQ